MLTEPLSSSSKPLRQRRKVDLPEPDGPITTSTSPRATCVLTESTARTSWPRASNTFTSSRTSITLRKPPFQTIGDLRQRQVDHQIKRRDAEPDLEGGERGGDCLTAALGQLGNGDHRDQRGVLDQADELPSQRWQHALERLRQDHMAHRLCSIQPQRTGCLILAT